MTAFDPARSRYVSVTTFRKSGERVATPVWTVPLDGGRIGVVTAPESGKAKRLRNDSRVELTECDLRGRIGPDAVTLTGRATITVGGAELDRARRALRTKYGVQAVVVGAWSSIKAKLTRRPLGEAVLVITLDEALR
ncbi:MULTISPECIES: PPOX class F420-dependent oxidoreductase [Gordonia]|uniref:Pyridoxamine 5'-phosphate oxidase N-terminal domain-containing protein n=1 Tax=Gordonia sihwensis NBRC 108236 TaxID=1223544 RepID=L7LPY0_9ACTN|nr:MULTISPECIES: PPOX class F420-dependent oxidoreductase [Gordonia]AUH67291.1 PPOX class F420-dependent oxidoreductase [Gordonia sp. YC-JH1]MBY4569020.1 PPOX class F420-dependent oxidoreductase [Gordonia sihwensis]GAC62103.1 hypothetical protein GSI01S_28_00720 [Gordonia sihwensis NBRC 108236]